MFKTMRIGNFKGFKDTQDIEMAPITLLYGPNSSGKSSSIEASVLLKQTMDEHSSETTCLKTEGEYIDLGAYAEIVYRHDTNNKMKIGYEFPIVLKCRAEEEPSICTKIIRANALYEVIFCITKEEKIEVDSINIHINKAIKPTYRIEKNPQDNKYIVVETNESGNYFRNITEGVKAITMPSVDNDILNKVDSEGLMSWKQEAYAEVINQDIGRVIHLDKFLIDTSTQIQENMSEFDKWIMMEQDYLDPLEVIAEEYNKNIRNIKYIKPIRIQPAEYQVLSNIEKKEEWISILRHDNEKIKEVNKWLKKLNIGYEVTFETRKCNNGRQDISLELKDTINNVEVSVNQVGYGISQILPIIAESIVNRDKIIYMEQPELHIHPRLQTELG